MKRGLKGNSRASKRIPVVIEESSPMKRGLKVPYLPITESFLAMIRQRSAGGGMRILCPNCARRREWRNVTPGS